MHGHTIRILISFFIAGLAIPSFAVTTKDCPGELRISVSKPTIEKTYAKNLYENYFRENEVVSSVLKIVTKNSGRCIYRNEVSNSKIFQAEIKGSLKTGAIEPASIAVFGELPLATPNLPFDLSSFVVFGKIATLSPFAVTFSSAGDLYRVGESCSYGDCVVDYIYLGKFADFRVEAKP